MQVDTFAVEPVVANKADQSSPTGVSSAAGMDGPELTGDKGHEALCEALRKMKLSTQTFMSYLPHLKRFSAFHHGNWENASTETAKKWLVEDAQGRTTSYLKITVAAVNRLLLYLGKPPINLKTVSLPELRETEQTPHHAFHIDIILKVVDYIKKDLQDETTALAVHLSYELGGRN